MKKFAINIIVFILFFVGSAYSQISRTEAMGNLSFSLIDEDASFDPFQMGNNPAYLWISREKSRLDITQYNNADYGDYRRKYSSERNLNVGANVLWIQPLQKRENGTFQGRALYVYEKRSDVYRTLKYNTYAGEAFYFTDTTTGDIVYDGPLFEFSHSLPITDKFSVGGNIGYGLLNGLKKVYTYGETVYRNVYGSVGAVYMPVNGLTVGLDYKLFDTQERITASDVNLFTVITYHYRGDEHRIELSGSSQDYKIKKSGSEIGGQLYYTSIDNLELGIVGNYGTHNTESIFPIGGVELVDGYSWFENYNFEVRGRYRLNNKLVLALKGGYYYDYSWSENSKTNLLLWEWDITQAGLGVGASFENVLPGVVFGVETEIYNSNVDSSKYIDNRFNELTSTDYAVRFGIEYYVFDDFVLRGGYDYMSNEIDFVYGGESVTSQKVTFGVGYVFTDNFTLNLTGNWGKREAGDSRTRDLWDFKMIFKFLKF